MSEPHLGFARSPFTSPWGPGGPGGLSPLAPPSVGGGGGPLLVREGRPRPGGGWGGRGEDGLEEGDPA